MEKMRVGIIGCGKIFPMHAVSVSKLDQVQLVAVCDVKEERARAAAETFGCRFYTDYHQMFQQEKLDSVHICTPHYLHCEMALEAARRKIHVLTEKPMALSMEDAEKMVSAAEENQIRMMVSFQNRFNPGSLLIKEKLLSGELGKILAARMMVTWNRSDEYYSKSDWKGTWDKEGGGVMIDQAIHTLDLMNWFIDSPVEKLNVHMGNRAHQRIDVDDYAEGMILYRSGVRASFFAINYYTCDAPVEIELHCEQGTAKLVGEKAAITMNDGREFIADRDPRQTFDFGNVKQYWGVGHMKEIRHFYECLQSGAAMRNTAQEVLATQKLICDIYTEGRKNPDFLER